MSNTYLFDKVSELREKFSCLFKHKKKLKALQNYSNVAPFQHKKYLHLIKTCMDDGFLQDKEADFLDHMLKKYEVNFLDWSHKTRWLKNEMKRIANEQKREVDQYTFFDLNKKKEETYSVPLEILANQHQQQMAGRSV